MKRTPTEPPTLTRRSALGLAGAVTLGSALAGNARAGAAAAQGINPALLGTAITNGRIRQSVCRWCYFGLSVDELAAAAKRLGLVSVELLDPKDFPTVQKHGLECAMVNSHSIEKGLNDPANHEHCLAAITSAIEAAAEAGYPNVITFSGNRNGLSDEKGLRNCQRALAQVVPLAEQRGVTICMELLNSKVDHRDYMADNTPWGAELVERVGSQHFKLLYDIYHMQIMEGDVIRTIRQHHDKIGHYHTAGVPGRHELDENQELFYPAIVRAILDTGYQGVLGQELIPTAKDPIASLEAAVRLCDV